MINDWIHLAGHYLLGSPQRSADHVASEIDEEIAFHLEQRKQDMIQTGMTDGEAEAAARDRFGNVRRISAECYRVSMMGTTWLHRMHLIATSGLIVAVVFLVWNLFEQVRPANRIYEVQVAVVADGLAMRSRYQSFEAGESEPFRFTLPLAETIKMKFASSTGVSLVGIDVVPVERRDTAGNHEFVYFDSATSLTVQTDANGTAPLSCFQSGDQAVLMVRSDNDHWQRVAVTIPNEIPGDQQALAVHVDR